MKTWGLLCVMAIALSANAQNKPRVFVQGKGSENVSSDGSGVGGHHWGTWGSKSTIDAHDESMEVTKDLQKNCSGAIVTINESNADYIVMMNRESKQNRGLLRSNSQIQVANKAGDVLGTNATHTVGNAAKDACNLIVADWAGSWPGQCSAGKCSAGSRSACATSASVQPAVQTSSPSVQVVPAVATAGQAQVVSSGDSVADAAKKERQHQACLALAKDNPSINCQ